MGDFNISLLNYESHSDTNEFLNNMVSRYLLPYILHPTGLTDHSATVNDNIFSNNTDHDTYSGNILANLSDHFPQFLVINKINIDHKRCSYSNFNENNLVSDFSKIDNSFLNDPNINLNCRFEMFYDNRSSCVNHHVPAKKMTKRNLKFHTKP